ncbi:MAG: hypothetical protein QGG71_18475 [Pirellulaceae bacterium]|nr:hypothetical protein [Pirellulaceae bacterium]
MLATRLEIPKGRVLMFKTTIVLVVALVPSIASAQWYGSVDFMVPTRGATDENVFQRNETEVLDAMGAGTGVFEVGTLSHLSLDLDFVASGRATAGFQADTFGVEGSYLVTDQWNAAASVSNASGLLASPFTVPGSIPNPLVDNNTFASVAYQSKLESAQLNLTYSYETQKGEGMWKFGVRTIRLDEEFQYSSTNAVMTNTLVSNTDNRIIGPHVGFRGQTWAPGGAIALSVSGLLGYNDIDRMSVFNGATTITNTDAASLVGDASIEYLLALHPNVIARFGYQVLGLGSVGLAPNDPLINNNQTEGVVYSMPYFGVVVIR